MTTVDPFALFRGLERLMLTVGQDPRLSPEMARARREFFGVADARTSPSQDGLTDAPPAELRFAEWYLLERESDVLGETPVAAMARQVDSEPPVVAALRNSLVGVFAVEAASAEAVRLRDLQSDDQAHDMIPAPGLALAGGDLVVGRLFDDGSGQLVPSAAVAVQPGGVALAAAMRRDLAGLGLSRRLNQLELEHLLFHGRARAAAGGVPLERLEADLEALLRGGGKGHLSAAEISASLATAAQPGKVMRPLLDEVAFDTEVDISALQRLLWEVWNAHHGATPTAAPPTAESASPQTPSPQTPSPQIPSGRTLGEEIAKRIERGVENAEDMSQVFDDVAEILGEEIDDDDEEELLGSDDGDLDALVAEFLWDEECGDGPEKRLLGQLIEQQRESPVPVLHLESLGSGDLLRLLVQIYLAAAPNERADQVRNAVAILERFYQWAVRTQEYPIAGVVAECHSAFVDHVDRLSHASLALSSNAGAANPVLLRVNAVAAGAIEVVPSSGGGGAWVAAGDDLGLVFGDLIIGSLRRGDDGETATLGGMVLVLPAAIEHLLG